MYQAARKAYPQIWSLSMMHTISLFISLIYYYSYHLYDYIQYARIFKKIPYDDVFGWIIISTPSFKFNYVGDAKIVSQ